MNRKPFVTVLTEFKSDILGRRDFWALVTDPMTYSQTPLLIEVARVVYSAQSNGYQYETKTGERYAVSQNPIIVTVD